MISLIRMVIILMAVFAESRAILRYKDKKLNLFQLVGWSVVWGGLILAAFFINFIGLITSKFGFSNYIDLVIVLSIIILFYLYYRQMIMNHDLSTQITTLVREVALLSKNKTPKKKNKK